MPLRARVSVALLTLLLPLAHLSAQSHVYLFNNSLADQNGGPALVSDGGTLSATGYAFGVNQGLELTNAFANPAKYTIAMHFALTGVGYHGWTKILDYKNRSSDGGFYQSPWYSADLHADPGAIVGDGPANAYSAGVMKMTVLTRSAGNVFTAYVNGVQQFSTVDASGFSIFSTPNQLARFFEDDIFNGLEGAPGTIDYLAIWDTALTPDQIPTAIPVTGTPEPASMFLLGSGLVALGAARRRQKNARSAQ